MKRFLLLILLPATLAMGGESDVSGWRHDGSGRYEKAQPPSQWSAEKNILWKTKLPDWSNAQAILVGHRLFVNSEPNSLICVDARDGRLLWQRSNQYEDVLSEAEYAALKDSVGERAQPLRLEKEQIQTQMAELRRQAEATEDRSLRGKIRGLNLKVRELDQKINEIDPLNVPAKHRDNGFTSAVPVSDGERVYVVFGNGVAAAFDLEGKRLWSKLMEKPKHGWGHSASPVLAEGLVLIHILDLVALDKKTGAEQWRRTTPESWGSPVVTQIGTTTVVITAGTGDVYRADDGQKLASEVGGLQFATPLIQDGVLYLIEGDARALAIPEKLSTELRFETLWEARIKGSRHYASALIHDGLIYAVSREGWLTVLEQKTGAPVYEQRLDINGDNHNSVYPSPALAGGQLYIGFEEGVVLVIKPGRAYSEIARNSLEPFRGSPIFSGKHIYLRGLEHLYCIGQAN